MPHTNRSTHWSDLLSYDTAVIRINRSGVSVSDCPEALSPDCPGIVSNRVIRSHSRGEVYGGR
ncbi:MAG: hypothetical protein PPP55_08360 [Halorubrum sp.]